MANKEQLQLLEDSVLRWNEWKSMNQDVRADLTKANFSRATLVGVNLSNVNLSYADLSNADLSSSNFSNSKFTHANLSNANLSSSNFNEAWINNANLRGANLRHSSFVKTLFLMSELAGVTIEDADFTEANFKFADLSGANFSKANLKKATFGLANLNKADFSGADLFGAKFDTAGLNDADLRQANLVGAVFQDADLSQAKLQGANLRGATLERALVVGTNFSKAILTGSCLKNWNTDSRTNLTEVQADYVYFGCSVDTTRKVFVYANRRPSFGSFEAGEFSALFQKALETIDLVFTDGIDWQAFFFSFQELRSQYSDENIAIQAIEKKRGAFVVRIEVFSDADKSAIQDTAKELYRENLSFIEQRYRAELQAKDGEISAYRQQSANLMRITELLASKPMNSNINQTFSAPVGNATGDNHGRMSAIQNNYASNVEDITRLISLLHHQIQTFPSENRDETLDVMAALETEVKKPEPDKGRICRWLKKILLAGSAVGAMTGSVATFSGDLKDFTSNVNELAKIVGIPSDQIQTLESPDF